MCVLCVCYKVKRGARSNDSGARHNIRTHLPVPATRLRPCAAPARPTSPQPHPHALLEVSLAASAVAPHGCGDDGVGHLGHQQVLPGGGVTAERGRGGTEGVYGRQQLAGVTLARLRVLQHLGSGICWWAPPTPHACQATHLLRLLSTLPLARCSATKCLRAAKQKQSTVSDSNIHFCMQMGRSLSQATAGVKRVAMSLAQRAVYNSNPPQRHFNTHYR